MQRNAISVHFVPGMCLLAFDFVVYPIGYLTSPLDPYGYLTTPLPRPHTLSYFPVRCLTSPDTCYMQYQNTSRIILLQ
eukprot:151068-Rhodomonas_salina.1